jgi:flagellar assembly protein FliH
MKLLSRVFKSSQVIIDKSAYKIPNLAPLSNISFSNPRDELCKDDDEVLADDSVEANAEEEEALISERIEEMNRLYEETIDNAKEEAQKILSQSYEKSEEIMEKAREDGFEQGIKEGFEEGKGKADSIIKEALAIKKQAEVNAKSLVGQLEEDIVKLTISTIEKILDKVVEENHDTILGLIKLGLEKCAFTEDLVLRVSVEDYDFAIGSKDRILALSQNINDISIVQDKSLKKGGCIIDTPSGSIDSSIETQFNGVKEMYEELLKSE